MPLPRDETTAHNHWMAQDKSLARPLRSKDPGLTQVAGPQDIQAIVQREAQGEIVPTYRQRTAENLPDPVARNVQLIRRKTQRDIPAEEFLRHVESAEDFVTYQMLYGDMDDHRRGDLALKLSKLLFDKQREQQKQNNFNKTHEQRVLKNQIELQQKLKKMMAAGLIQDGRETGGQDGDA